MKLGKEIARFEQLAGVGQLERVYSISLRECGATLYRSRSPDAPKRLPIASCGHSRRELQQLEKPTSNTDVLCQ